MGTRRKSRELALQMLFQADLGKQPLAEVRSSFWQGRGDVAGEVKGFADDIFRVACDRAPEIDKMIQAHADNWRMDRMAAVDRNILRAGVAELMAYPATPRAVIINEAIEIAHKFSSPESVHFINGVLDSIGKELEKGAGARDEAIPVKSLEPGA
jgi:transcription antitermination protein NusB